MEPLVQRVFISLDDKLDSLFNRCSLRVSFNKSFGKGKFDTLSLCDFVTLYRIQYLLIHNEISDEDAENLIKQANGYEILKSLINHNPGDLMQRAIKIDCEVEMTKTLPLIFDLKSYVDGYDPDFDEDITIDDYLYQETYRDLENMFNKLFAASNLNVFFKGRKVTSDSKNDFGSMTPNRFLNLYKVQSLQDDGTIPTKELANSIMETYDEFISLNNMLSYVEDISLEKELEEKRASKLAILRDYGLPVSLNLRSLITSYRISPKALKDFQMINKKQIQYDD